MSFLRHWQVKKKVAVPSHTDIFIKDNVYFIVSSFLPFLGIKKRATPFDITLFMKNIIEFNN